MSNRFGPSENCPVCGDAVYPDDLVMCDACEKTMCTKCLPNHRCEE